MFFFSKKSKPKDDYVVARQATDPDLLEATRKAQFELPRFIEFFIKNSSNSRFAFNIKKRFVEGDEIEHMWIRIHSFENSIFFGQLNNAPMVLKYLKCGDPVSLKKENIEDWIIYDIETGVADGAFSHKALSN